MELRSGPAQNLDWLYEVRNGRAFSLYTAQIAVAAQNSHIQLLNPAASGKTVILYDAMMCAQSAVLVTFAVYSVALATLVGTGVNLSAGGTAGVGEIRRSTNVGGLGSGVGHRLYAAALSEKFTEPWMIVLDAGEGCVFINNTINDQLNGSLRWVER